MVMAPFTFSQLSPTAFLERSARVFPDRTAVVDGDRRFSYREFADRSRRLAGALAAGGIFPGDPVAALCSNSSAMLELHNGVPWAGAVLVPLNVRLSAEELEYIVRHCGARFLIADEQLRGTAAEVASAVGIPLVVAGEDADEYEQMLAGAEPLARPCPDERGLLALNYTYGTTGRPKGVMYHHRGAYLQSLAMAMHTGLGTSSRYLWTLPMFHCDGWCFPWAVSAAGATHVCLPRVDPSRIWRLLRSEGITHFSAAPTVLTMIANAAKAAAGPLQMRFHVQTGGAPPTPTLLARMSALNMEVTHLYGLTETYGPLAINQWHPEWNDLPTERQAECRGRQGTGTGTAAPRRRSRKPTPARAPAMSSPIRSGSSPRTAPTSPPTARRSARSSPAGTTSWAATTSTTRPRRPRRSAGPPTELRGSEPATSPSSIPTATSRSATGARTSSSP